MSTLCFASSSTALRPSASVVIQCGVVMRPGSGIVMPRPALKNRAAPGIVWPRIVEQLVGVRADAQRGADAVIGAQLQVADEPSRVGLR